MLFRFNKIFGLILLLSIFSINLSFAKYNGDVVFCVKLGSSATKVRSFVFTKTSSKCMYGSADFLKVAGLVIFDPSVEDNRFQCATLKNAYRTGDRKGCYFNLSYYKITVEERTGLKKESLQFALGESKDHSSTMTLTPGLTPGNHAFSDNHMGLVVNGTDIPSEGGSAKAECADNYCGHMTVTYYPDYKSGAGQ